MGIDERMHASGKRMTIQRRLVMDALQRARHHVTADEIATRIRARHPQIDPSTVYRNLEALEELGYVTHTHFDDRVTRWHRADAERHGHLVCRELRRRAGASDRPPRTARAQTPRRARLPRGSVAFRDRRYLQGLLERIL